MKKSTYKSGSGHLVTLYESPSGASVTVIDGEWCCYTSGGEMYGAPSLEAALHNIGYTGAL